MSVPYIEIIFNSMSEQWTEQTSWWWSFVLRSGLFSQKLITKSLMSVPDKVEIKMIIVPVMKGWETYWQQDCIFWIQVSAVRPGWQTEISFILNIAANYWNALNAWYLASTFSLFQVHQIFVCFLLLVNSRQLLQYLSVRLFQWC